MGNVISYFVDWWQNVSARRVTFNKNPTYYQNLHQPDSKGKNPMPKSILKVKHNPFQQCPGPEAPFPFQDGFSTNTQRIFVVEECFRHHFQRRKNDQIWGKDNKAAMANQNPANVKKQVKNIHNTLSRYWACTWDLLLPSLYDEEGMFRGKLNGPEVCDHLECTHEKRDLSLNNLQNYIWDLDSNLRYKFDKMLSFWALHTHFEASMMHIHTTPDFSTLEGPETVAKKSEDESDTENDTNISGGNAESNIESDIDNEAEVQQLSDTEKGELELPTFQKMAI